MLALSQDVREVSERSRVLENAVATIERELGRAAQEAAFLRSRDAVPAPRARASKPPARVEPAEAIAPMEEESEIYTGPEIQRTPADLRAEAASLEFGRYGEFTVSRYNRTMGGLQARRRWVAVGVLVLAGAISIALVTLAVLAHEPEPPLWLAVLPVIWMVPVPFFALSFRGTHRVLRRTRFDLPEVP